MKKFMTHALPLAGALSLGILLAAGCGGGGSTKSTPAPTAAAKPVEKPVEMAPAPDATSAAATPAPATFAGVPTVDVAGATIGEEARGIFGTRCAACHGVTGQGDGLAAAALNPKPRSYSDVTWQDSVTDDHIAKTIVEGGASVGKSPLMAPNPDLASKPEVVKDLVRIVRTYKVKA